MANGRGSPWHANRVTTSGNHLFRKRSSCLFEWRFGHCVRRSYFDERAIRRAKVKRSAKHVVGELDVKGL